MKKMRPRTSPKTMAKLFSVLSKRTSKSILALWSLSSRKKGCQFLTF